MLFCRWFHHRPPTQSVCITDVILGTDRLLCPGGRGFSEKCGVYPPQMKTVPPPLAITIFKCPPPPPAPIPSGPSPFFSDPWTLIS